MGQFDGLPKTTSLKLNKPGYDNVADILALNENADILDSKIAEILNAIIIASQNEAELGNDNAKMMTPLRVKQAILKLVPKPAIASQAEAEAGTDNTKHMTALRVKQSILKNAPVPDLTPYAKLASPAFTGTPTAPTVAKTTNNTQIATTAFVHALTGAVNNGGIVAQSLGQNGFVKFANGLILQWGKITAGRASVDFTYPLSITNLLSITLIREQDYSASNASAFVVRKHDNTKATLNVVTSNELGTAYAYVILLAK